STQYKVVDTLDHASYPTTRVLREMNISGNQAALKLFRVSFFYQNFVKGARSRFDRFQPEFRVELLNGLHQEGEQEFVLEVFDEDDFLQLNCHYDPTLFEDKSINGIIDNFTSFLGELISRPDMKLGDYQLLSPDQQHTLSTKWQGETRTLPQDKTVVDLFAEQARKTPDQIALQFDNEIITYEELNLRSDKLAKKISYAVDDQSWLIGVGCERSADMIIALLAVMKTGAAYVPIDPDYPKERVAAIIEESKIATIVSNAGSASVFHSLESNVAIINTSTASEDDLAFNSKASQNSLAYVLFTSGSTGTPKGVMITHRGLLNLSLAMQEAYEITSEDKVLQFASLSFDMSIEEIFPYLISGSGIVIRDKDDIEGQRFLKLVTEKEVTVLNLPPAMGQTLMQYSDGEKERFYKKLRLISFGGDQLDAEVTEAIRPYNIRIFNAYGPTEYTVNATLAELTHEHKVTIGRPVLNTEVYILDKNLKPVPVLAHGELYLSGASLSAGYLYSKNLTNERFIANPFVPGAKMYRTGDNVRWNAEGNIEFLGRLDYQVKIRGFRVELQEVEAVLTDQPDITSSVVIANKVGREKWLAGYFTTSDPNKTINETSLRNLLAKRLPDYMVPARLIQLDVMPITANGKIDRKALEQMEVTFESSNEYVAPVTDQEFAVVAVWTEVLGIDKVGLNDNFFELGGHSLLATQVISRLNKTLEKDLPLSSLFENPQVSTLIDYINADTSDKQYEPIAKASNRESLPLSYAQERLWFLSETGLSDQYHVPLLFDLTGKFYPDAFENAINAVISRHESLRTVFRLEGELPVQEIQKTVNISMTRFDLTNNGTSPDRLIETFINESFDLVQGPLVRAIVIKKTEDQWVFGMNMHHIICDGWSSQIIASELSGFYNAAVTGVNYQPEMLTVQYPDFAEWQRKQSAKFVADDLPYWKNLLEGHQDLDLQTDYVRPKKTSGRGDRVKTLIAQENIQRIKKTCTEHKITFFSFLMTTVYMLLHKYSRQSDLSIGYSVANRTHPDIRNLIGFFVNTLILRVQDYDKQNDVTDLLKKIHATMVANQDHQQLPFEKLVEELQPQRDPGRSPIFQTMVTYLNNSQTALDMAGAAIALSDYSYHISKFDLSFDFNESAEGELAIAIEYSTDLFRKETVERMLNHLKNLMDEMSNFSVPVQSLEMISQAEKHQLLADFNQSEEPYPNETDIYSLFASQVIKTPDAIAVTDGKRSLTYALFDEKVDLLSRYLLSQSIQKETVIAICMDRSIEMIIAVFSILKAGAAYLPIGIENPDDRIAYMMEDSETKVVFTDQDQTERIESLAEDIKVIPLDDAFLTNLDAPIFSNELPKISSTNLCYIIYTSGSTGKPKGVMLEHQGVINYLYDMVKYYRFEAADVGRTTYAFIGNISFDATATAFLVPLVSGGTSYVLGAKYSQQDIVKKVFESDEINCVCLTPSHLKLLFDTGFTPSATRKFVSLGGEPVREELIVAVLELGVKAEIVNVYGPTECSVAASAHLFDRSRDYESNIPIGKPISNTKLFVLDSNNQLVPIGVPGELHIGGEGVARGYLKRPELTAERFIDNSYAENEKIYKTGDLVKWQSDGSIEFLGRIDDQVKIRGYRIELGEIENLILSLGKVDNCAVLIAGEDAGKNIVAFYQSATDPDPAELKLLVKEKLPKYMVPVAFIQMNPLPVTPNGKIDRKKLAGIPVEITSSGEYIAPQSELQEKLAGIWQDILGIERIGINDDFFEVGGHSLLATQIITRINRQVGCNLQIDQLFESPNIAELSGLIDDNSSSPVSRQKTIPVADRPDNIPASYAQQRLWFLDKMGQGDQFHTPYVCDIHGSLNVEYLNSAISSLISRHESLRTHFKEIDGKPYQQISDEVKFSLAYEDLTLLRKNDQVVSSNELTKQYVNQSFDLSTGPLIRAVLIRFGLARYRLVLCLHHIITDGWSVNIMLSEISEFYNAKQEKRVPELQPLPIQYADYSIWQTSEEVKNTWEAELDYWKNQLQGYKDLNMPVDFFRENQTTGKGEQEYNTFSGRELSAIKGFCQQHRITPFALMMSSIYIILSRYSNQKDFCIGFPIANRNLEEKEALIGFFLNTLIVRINTEDRAALTVSELIRLVQDQVIESQVHQNIPVDKIIECLQPDRNAAITPVFQVMMNYLNTTADATFQLGDARVSTTPIDYDSSKFDLSFSFGENSDKIIISIEYNQDLFSLETIQRLSAQLKLVTEAIITDAEAKVSGISMLRESEQEDLLVVRNDTWTDFPVNQCIHDLFREQVKRSPDAVALTFGDQTMSYTTLDRQSDHLAAYLYDRGVTAEEIVGIMIDRSFDMIVGLLGILKAGAAYLPIDADYPEERKVFIQEDSKVRIILTAGTIPENLAAGVEVIDLATEREAIEGSVPVEIKVSPDNLAYLIYTSGSTGKPKGVMVEHKNVVNHNLAVIEEYELSANDNVMQFSTISFDIFVEEVFPSLLCGASVTLLDGNRYTDPKYILDVIAANKVTTLNLPTAFWNAIAPNDFSASTLKKVIIGGEKAEIETFRIWQTHNSGIPVINTYGPTEATVIALTYEIDENPDRPVPVGKPISNVQVYVLNDQLQPRAIGVPGELYISGAGVARGYFGNPDLTAEKFIDNPFIPGKKMYRTGDLVRWLNDGNIEFLGRADDQVKIRGYRIEPGEVEHALRNLNGISNAAVIVKEINGTKNLVGFYVSESDMNAALIRDMLGTRLPEYMVPAFIESVIAIPLTPNGKVDKRKLAGVKLSQSESHADDQELSGNTEIVLASLWQELLGKEQIKANHNFFQLGGHSLLAIQLISRIREKFATTVSLAELFRSRTLAEQAAMIKNTGTTGDIIESGPEALLHRPEDIPLSFSQERLWFIHEFGQSVNYHIPGFLQVRGNIELDALNKALNYVISRHESLRTSFRKKNKTVYQFVHDDLSVKIEEINRIGASTSEVDGFLEEFLQTPFDLLEGPLLRAVLVRTGESTAVFGFCIHHIVSDGWSGRILSAELKVAYNAFIAGQIPDLPKNTIQYADYTIWQHNRMDTEKQTADLQALVAHLEGYEKLAVPTDFSRPEILSGKGARVKRLLSSELVQEMRKVTADNGSTLFGGLMTCAYLTIYGYSGQKDITSVTPYANRDHSSIENLIGFFVNTVINRIRLNTGGTLLQMLADVQEELIRGQEYKDVPFEKVVNALNPVRDTSRPSVFQLMINHILVTDIKDDFQNIELEYYDKDFNYSKFDLNIAFSESQKGEVALEIEFCTDLYEEATVAGMMNSLIHVMTEFTRRPDQIVDQVELADENEIRFIENTFNIDRTGDLSHASIHEFFRYVASQNPERPAVSCAGKILTYHELDEKSDQVAIALQEAGVQYRDYVGVCLRRDIGFITALMGILKAGAAYMPIDPGYPTERISYMLSDSQASALITDLENQEKCNQANPEKLTTLLLEEIQSNQVENELIVHPSAPEDVSYVIYTSGSTGKPKGVLQTHQTMINLMMYQYEGEQPFPEGSSSQFASVSFDVSVQEIFYGILGGRTLHIIPEEVKLLPAKVVEIVVDNS
ncbi:MAG: amino acid adenylation domain-containing protein, partial [Cyclobacteriaceae bacterium]